MSEPIGNSFRTIVAAGILLGALSMCAALYLLSQGELVDGVVLGAITYFLFRMFWRANLRKRELLRRGYYTGRRVGTHWVYDELQDGLIESLEFPLEYIGRGEYDIHIPGRAGLAATACHPGHANAAPKSSSDCRRCSSAARFISTRTRRRPRPPVAERVVVLVRLRPVGRERPADVSRRRGTVAAILLGRARQPRGLAQTSRAGACLLQRASREGLGRANPMPRISRSRRSNRSSTSSWSRRTWTTCTNAPAPRVCCTCMVSSALRVAPALRASVTASTARPSSSARNARKAPSCVPTSCGLARRRSTWTRLANTSPRPTRCWWLEPR